MRKVERYLVAGVVLAILIVVFLHIRGRRRAEAIRQQRAEGEAAAHS